MAAFWLSPATGVEQVDMFLSVPCCVLGTEEHLLVSGSDGGLSFCFLLHLFFFLSEATGVILSFWFLTLSVEVGGASGVLHEAKT